MSMTRGDGNSNGNVMLMIDADVDDVDNHHVERTLRLTKMFPSTLLWTLDDGRRTSDV